MHRIRLWTDGCCLDNPGGRGGWAFVVEARGRAVHEVVGTVPATDAERMELLAVVNGLAFLDSRGVRLGPVEVLSDSTWVVVSVSRWLGTWKKHGWTRWKRGMEPERVPVEHADLWAELDRLLGRHEVTFRWVKGHANHEHNMRADQLARAAAKKARRIPA